MDQRLEQWLLEWFRKMPEELRQRTATEADLARFEERFGPIPEAYRRFLAQFGGGPCGPEYIDGIDELFETHEKYREESALPAGRGWTMKDVFIIGWDGGGNPYGICAKTGRILVEDHDFGGIHEMAPSFEVLVVSKILDDGTMGPRAPDVPLPRAAKAKAAKAAKSKAAKSKAAKKKPAKRKPSRRGWAR